MERPKEELKEEEREDQKEGVTIAEETITKGIVQKEEEKEEII